MISRLVNIYFPLCSMTINIIICIIFFSKRRVENTDTKIYSKLLLIGLTESIIMFTTNLLVGLYFYQINHFVFKLLNKLLYVIYIIFLAVLFSYVYAVKNKMPNPKKDNLKDLVCCGAATAFSILILIAPINLVFKNNLGNSYGTASNFLFVGCAFFLLLTITYSLKDYKKLEQKDKKKFFPMFLLFVLMTIMMIIRYFDPFFNISSNIFSLILLVMFFTIENPDVKTIEELEQAKKDADAANSAKTDFLSNMSHEIRTPLNAIVGFSEFLEEAKSLDEVKENAQDILSASNTLLEIVNSILDISKIEAGKLEIVETAYNAPEVFSELSNMMKPKMASKNLDYTCNIAPDLPAFLYGDVANLKKIITNLLSNAYKYTQTGYVHFDVSCVKANNICKLIISVEDSGRGIKKENVDKLFTKFERLEEEKNTTIEGTGLGLALTKQLVEMLGGRIIVHTIYGEGSKFTVVLNQKIAPKPAFAANKFTEANFSSLKIIVVDDNEMNLKVSKKLLERFSITNIILLKSGYDLISKISSGETADAILLDIMMPKMDGVDTLNKLKSMNNFNIPVVALTANAISGSKNRYLSDGFFAYLSKPIAKEELVKVLNKIATSKEEAKKQTEEPEILDELPPVEAEEIIEPPEIDAIAYLKKKGVEIDKSLELLGDIEMYNDTIKDFLKEVEDKWMRIERYKLEGNMEDYAIDVHSLKSDCKYLGFTKLAELSYEHELSSKANDKDFVNNNFLALEEEFNKVLVLAKDYVERYVN